MKLLGRFGLAVGLTMACVGLAASSASAVPLTFTGSQGSGADLLSASATFDVSGNDLIVTLTNTSSEDVEVPADVLTAVFFSLAGDPTLDPVSAILAPGSAVYLGGVAQSPPPGGVVGGEWAYKDGVALPGGGDEGIASVGLGVFGPPDLFPGPNLSGPESPNGIQYGLLSAGDNPTTGNTPIMTEPLVKNSVVFTLSGLPDDYVLGVSNVFFQYGTDFDEPGFPGVPGVPAPEPASVLLLGTGLVALGIWGRRRLGGARA